MDKYSDNHVKMLCQWVLAFSRSENWYNAYAAKELISGNTKVCLFLIPKDPQGERSHGKQKSDCRDIPIEWAKLIKSARIDKHCSQAELKSLQQACFAAGINPKFSCGALMGGKKPHDTPPTNSVDIAFDLFCIDDMQGSSRLKIKQKE